MKNVGFLELNARQLEEVDGGEYEPYFMMDQASAAWFADGSATADGMVCGAIASFIVGVWKALF